MTPTMYFIRVLRCGRRRKHGRVASTVNVMYAYMPLD